MNRKCSIRGFRRGHHLVVNKIIVPCRGKLLKRDSTSILLRTVDSTLLNTTTLNSVNGRFPSDDGRFLGVSDQVLLEGIIYLLGRGNCGVNGVSTAMVTRGPGVSPRVTRVHQGVTRSYNIALSGVGIGTAARRKLNFANGLLKVSTRTIYVVRWWGLVSFVFFVRKV